MEFLNGTFIFRGFQGMNSSRLRLKFLSGFLPSFFCLFDVHEFHLVSTVQERKIGENRLRKHHVSKSLLDVLSG
jgi:hypothetical protein